MEKKGRGKSTHRTRKMFLFFCFFGSGMWMFLERVAAGRTQEEVGTRERQALFNKISIYSFSEF